MIELHQHFDAIWSIDFEYSAPTGERPDVACLVGREYFSKQLTRIFKDELTAVCPFENDKRTLIVAYFASAEMGCYLSLGWPIPTRVLDLYVEFRNLTNGLDLIAGRGLIGCLTHFGLDSIASTEKEEMRELAMRGGQYTESEREALLDYCQSDVDALDRLLDVMLPKIDLPRAMLRGRYMAAVAHMERTGVPIDTDTLCLFRDSWSGIKDKLIAEVDQAYGVYDGQTFKQSLFARWLITNNIPWPTTTSGRLATDDDTFRKQAKRYPQVGNLRELRHSLTALKLESLAVGADRRNRCLLSPFQSRTGRNQPSNSKFIYGPSVWLRGLIKPSEGMALAYIDWSQQELGIAAALSGDRAMTEAYLTGDPYLAFAIQAGAVPPTATRQSHPNERGQFKICALAVQYGMSERGLAESLGESSAFARNLLRMHRETYPQFWRWSQEQVDIGMLRGYMETVFGWRIHTTTGSNPRSLANFPMQANGAEMLRIACCLATEAGISVCCPVHDAILVEGTSDSIDDIVARTQDVMREASRAVLDGFELESDSEVIRSPDRYTDADRGADMWQKVISLAEEQRQVTPSLIATEYD